VNKERLKSEWAGFIATLSPQEIAALEAANIDVGDYFSENLPEPHRRIYDASYADRMAVKQEAQEENTSFSSLVSIIARVIDALDCTNNREVLLHNDCIRMALGYRNYKSMADVAKKYGVDKATISWRVKQIQHRLKLPPSCYMRSDSDCENIKQGVIKSNQKKNERKTSRHRRKA
jgi:hypothetical protein